MGKSKTTIVNIHTGDPYDVYCGRTGKGIDGYFGNYSKSKTKSKKIADYKVYFYERIKKDETFKRRVHELKGKRLGCFCWPKPCHVEIIVEYLDSLDDQYDCLIGI